MCKWKNIHLLLNQLKDIDSKIGEQIAEKSTRELVGFRRQMHTTGLSFSRMEIISATVLLGHVVSPHIGHDVCNEMFSNSKMITDLLLFSLCKVSGEAITNMSF